jgi:hypothetical protein
LEAIPLPELNSNTTIFGVDDHTSLQKNLI